jgi:hypothetical protein
LFLPPIVHHEGIREEYGGRSSVWVHGSIRTWSVLPPEKTLEDHEIDDRTISLTEEA